MSANNAGCVRLSVARIAPLSASNRQHVLTMTSALTATEARSLRLDRATT